jgi:hypothetical protein
VDDLDATLGCRGADDPRHAGSEARRERDLEKAAAEFAAATNRLEGGDQLECPATAIFYMPARI